MIRPAAHVADRCILWAARAVVAALSTLGADVRGLPVPRGAAGQSATASAVALALDRRLAVSVRRSKTHLPPRVSVPANRAAHRLVASACAHGDRVQPAVVCGHCSAPGRCGRSSRGGAQTGLAEAALRLLELPLQRIARRPHAMAVAASRGRGDRDGGNAHEQDLHRRRRSLRRAPRGFPSGVSPASGPRARRISIGHLFSYGRVARRRTKPH